MPRVALVTGAHGFIGRHLARSLNARGWQVTGVGHGAWDREEQRAWGIHQWHEAAVTTAALSALDVNPDVVVHCAGSSTVGASFHRPLQEFERTVASTAAVLDAIRRLWPGSLLVYPSSAAVYGEARAVPIAETAPVAPLSPYGTFKDQAEQLCRLYGREWGVRSIVLRIFSVYGAGLRKQLFWDACRKFAAGDPAFEGTGLEVRDWIHIDDLAHLVAALIERTDLETTAVINAGTGIGTDIARVLDMIGSHAGHAGGVRFSGVGRPGDPTAYVADIGRARALGWQPGVSLDTGVAEYVKWYQALDAGRRPAP